uniref:Uncharacterized protein n=1 Tax=viral metagenome TaxID=1070528 RepID=A0A6C0BDH1_9ZZZZ
MSSLEIKTSREGKKDVYKTTFRCKGSLKKVVEYLKGTEMPVISQYPEVGVIDVDSSNDGVITKIIRSSLPDTEAVNLYLGCKFINIKYDIAYDENTLVSVCKNPDILNNLFKFTEFLTVEQHGDDLIFERVAKVRNIGKLIPILGSSYQIYDDHFNNQSIAFYLGISEASK